MREEIVFHCEHDNTEMVITEYTQFYRSYIEYTSPSTMCFYSNKLELIPERVYNIHVQCPKCGIKDVFTNITAADE